MEPLPQIDLNPGEVYDIAKRVMESYQINSEDNIRDLADRIYNAVGEINLEREAQAEAAEIDAKETSFRH